MIENEIRQMLSQPRDSNIENNLIKKLRKLDENYAYDLIKIVFWTNVSLGLMYSKRVLRNSNFFLEILNHGMHYADASIINLYLDCCISNLGFKKVALIIRDSKNTYPGGYKKALYWLPRHLPKDDIKSAKILSSFKDS